MAQNELAGLDPRRDFPLATHRSELIRTPTGKRLEEITLDAVLDGAILPSIDIAQRKAGAAAFAGA
jgi:propanediol dehydratase small subunit